MLTSIYTKKLQSNFEERLRTVYEIQEKQERSQNLKLVKKEIIEAYEMEKDENLAEINEIISSIEKNFNKK